MAPRASRVIGFLWAGSMVVLVAVMQLAASGIDPVRPSGVPEPTTRPWSGREVEGWLPPVHETRTASATEEGELVGVRCATGQMLEVGEDAVLINAFVCDVRTVTGGIEAAERACGFAGSRDADGLVVTVPTLSEAPCRAAGPPRDVPDPLGLLD